MLEEIYVHKPNLPHNKVTCVLVDYRICAESEKTLANMGIKVLKTAKLNSLYESVNGHPDMQIHHIYDNIFVCENTLTQYYKNLLPDAIIVSGNTRLMSNYPYDIAYNGAKIGNYFFHYLNYTDSKIIEYYKTNGEKLINVKQGYTKCSVAVINENAIITSDIKIAQNARNVGIDALFYENDQIILKGQNCGFFGGICGKIDKNTLVMNGNIDKLRNSKSLLKFCQKYEVTIKSLNNKIPEDIGSILPIKQIQML